MRTVSALHAITGLPVDSGELPLVAPALPSHGEASKSVWKSVGDFCNAVRRGNEAAVRELHHRYAERLIRYSLVVARGDETAAREAVQNAFLKALRSLRNLPDESALWAWLARAARTSLADAGRRTRRYATALARFTALFSSPLEPDPPEDTEAIWHTALEKSLATLNEAERSLIDARYTHRQSLAEIAVTAATTERAIEGRLARLREKLRTAILRQLAAQQHEPR